MDDMNNGASNDINSDINNSESAANKRRKKFFNAKNTIIALVIIVVFLLGSISSIGFISIINKTSPTNILNGSTQNEKPQKLGASAGSNADNNVTNSSNSYFLVGKHFHYRFYFYNK